MRITLNNFSLRRRLQVRKSLKSKKNQSGFTLIEIMVVVVILGILAALIVPRVMNRPEQARRVKAKQDILAIENAMDMYQLDNGQYPTQKQGLNALITKPVANPVPDNYPAGGYLKQPPIDPWKRPYLYLNPGKHGDIDIFTFGKDGKADADVVGNWQSSMPKK